MVLRNVCAKFESFLYFKIFLKIILKFLYIFSLEKWKKKLFLKWVGPRGDSNPCLWVDSLTSNPINPPAMRDYKLGHGQRVGSSEQLANCSDKPCLWFVLTKNFWISNLFRTFLKPFFKTFLSINFYFGHMHCSTLWLDGGAVQCMNTHMTILGHVRSSEVWAIPEVVQALL